MIKLIVKGDADRKYKALSDKFDRYTNHEIEMDLDEAESVIDQMNGLWSDLSEEMKQSIIARGCNRRT